MNHFKEISDVEFDKNPFQLIGRDWMLIAAEKDGNVNAMTASWGGLGVMWGRNVAYVVMRPQRFTKGFVDGADRFSLSFFGEGYKKVLSYMGTVSGRDEDKMGKSGLTVSHYGEVPYFEEASLVLVCKRLFQQDYDESSFLDGEIIEKWYPDKDFHTLYIVEIDAFLSKD